MFEQSLRDGLSLFGFHGLCQVVDHFFHRWTQFCKIRESDLLQSSGFQLLASTQEISSQAKLNRATLYGLPKEIFEVLSRHLAFVRFVYVLEFDLVPCDFKEIVN